ncbi:MAG: hypothetical protein JSS20_18740, partial [Proteobacteria bacterium]|nr:hypothetical protein [Pseudomonadota bacterium]
MSVSASRSRYQIDAALQLADHVHIILNNSSGAVGSVDVSALLSNPSSSPAPGLDGFPAPSFLVGVTVTDPGAQVSMYLQANDGHGHVV